VWTDYSVLKNAAEQLSEPSSMVKIMLLLVRVHIDSFLDNL
jgi:hypothetical protein